jgi:hypothetical protein
VHRPALLAALVGVAVLVGGCGATAPSDRGTPPRVGACRDLTAKDVGRHTNDTPVVPCTARHTAQTFQVGSVPRGTTYDDPANGRYVYDRCAPAFGRYLGADESTVLRTLLGWAWFRPSESAWKQGARWFRCDVVGGPDGARTLRPLPRALVGLFRERRPDAWLACARGARFAGSEKVPCTDPHDWRAVTTIKLGEPADAYPGDRLVEVRSRDFCSDSVGAWLNYQPDYQYAYTWFHEAEWQAGNRRSICWARTDR